MEQLTFNHKSSRAKKARLGSHLKGPWVYFLIVLALALFSVGALLLANGFAIGWFVCSLVALPLMVVIWYREELKSLDPIMPSKTIDDALSGDILAKLPHEPTPYDIATAVGATQSGFFFAVRFGVTPSFLQNIASKDKKQTEDLWRDAWSLRQQLESDEITGEMLIASLVRSVSEHDTMLAHLHLTSDDLVKGVLWQRHIIELIMNHARPKRTGGIGRDWAFGYIPTLSRFGRNISEQVAHGGLLSVDLESHLEALDQLIKTFSSSGRQSSLRPEYSSSASDSTPTARTTVMASARSIA